MLTSLLSLCLFLAAGCVKTPSPEFLAAAEYGAAPPEDHQRTLRLYIIDLLASAKDRAFTFEKPVKGYTLNNHVRGTTRQFGWVVCGTVNSRVRFAGYKPSSGPVPFYALYVDGEINSVMIGLPPEDEEVSSRTLNGHIRETCFGIGPKPLK